MYWRATFAALIISRRAICIRCPGTHILGDLRYALFPQSTEALWGIRFDPNQPDQHIAMVYFREPSKAAFQQLWQMICGQPL